MFTYRESVCSGNESVLYIQYIDSFGEHVGVYVYTEVSCYLHYMAVRTTTVSSYVISAFTHVQVSLVFKTGLLSGNCLQIDHRSP